MTDPRLISVDELRAAGALDVPPAWRKSLGSEPRRERDLFSDLDDQDDQVCIDQPRKVPSPGSAQRDADVRRST